MAKSFSFDNLSSSTFSSAGGAVDSLFAGFAATDQAELKAKGLNLQAQSTRLNAQSLRIKASGDLAEGANYDLAAELSEKNRAFTEQSTAIKETQIGRQVSQTIGQQTADVAGAGFGSGGSAMFMLMDSAAQGRLTQSVAEEQGHITEASYQEQADSYKTLSTAAKGAAAGEYDIANQTDTIANQTDDIARQTIEAGKTAATGDFISSAFKGATAIATLLV